MKIIKNKTAIKNPFYSLFLVFFAYSGFAQNSDILSSHTSGQSFLTDFNNFKLIPNGKVSNRGQVDLNDLDIIWSDQFGEYEIYIDNNPQREGLGEGYPLSDYYLLYDDDKQKIAIFTGNIVCQLNNDEDAIDIANDYNLSLSHNFPSINQAFYNFEDLDGLQVILEQLQLDYRVKKAYPEILENFRRAQ
ncbi:MAG: hypothetical protein CMD44_03860 [Gammaproteobacteria bacterium]|nr:hypothetical protein [Gammaproteobacteria bacterium]